MEIIQQNAAFVSAVGTILLVLVTGLYVYFTFWISKSSGAAAEAARQSAELSQRQIQIANRPLVIPEFSPHIDYIDEAPEKVRISLVNIGNGPALDIIASLELSNLRYLAQGPGFEYPAIALPVGKIELHGEFRGETEDLSLLRKTNAIPGSLLISYKDISGQGFISNTSFYIDKKTGLFTRVTLSINEASE